MERRNVLCNAVQASLLIRAVLSTNQVGINPHTPGGGKVLMSNTFCAETGPNYQGDYCSNELAMMPCAQPNIVTEIIPKQSVGL